MREPSIRIIGAREKARVASAASGAMTGVLAADESGASQIEAIEIVGELSQLDHPLSSLRFALSGGRSVRATVLGGSFSPDGTYSFRAVLSEPSVADSEDLPLLALIELESGHTYVKRLDIFQPHVAFRTDRLKERPAHTDLSREEVDGLLAPLRRRRAISKYSFSAQAGESRAHGAAAPFGPEQRNAVQGARGSLDRPATASILIVTPQLAGFTEGSAAGELWRDLGCMLARSGHEVRLLFTGEAPGGTGERDRWKRDYSRRGIVLEYLASAVPRVTAPARMRRAYRLFESIRSRPPANIIIAPEQGGELFYAALARSQGTALPSTVLCTVLTGSAEWHRDHRPQSAPESDFAIVVAMEQEQVLRSDLVVSVDSGLLEWTRKQMGAEEGRTFLAVIPESAEGTSTAVERATAPSAEQLAEKQLILCSAELTPVQYRELLSVVRDYCASPVSGERMTVVAEDLTELEHELEGLGIEMIRRADLPLLISRERRKSVRAIVFGNGVSASLAESVLEKKHVNWSRVGDSGLRDAVKPGIRGHAASTSGAGFAIRIDSGRREPGGGSSARVASGARLPSPNGTDRSRTGWDLITSWRATTDSDGARKGAGERLSISVCITHYERPSLLPQALSSVLAQTVAPDEIVIIDDGSSNPDTLALLTEIAEQHAADGVRVVRIPNVWIGAARNVGASLCRGDYIVFLDDDNLLKPHAIERLTQIQRTTGAEILTPAVDVFGGADAPSSDLDRISRVVWLGGFVGPGLRHNCLGDTAGLINRARFLELGGFDDERGLAYEDWAFHLRAAMAGVRFETSPEALWWYRYSPASLNWTHGGLESILRAHRQVTDRLPEGIRPLISIDSGAYRHSGFLRFISERHTREYAEQMFYETFNILGRWNSATGFDELAPIRDLEIEDGDRLEILSVGEDPCLLLPEIRFQEGYGIVVRVEIECPEATRVELFFQRKGDTDYLPTSFVAADAEAGSNELYFGVFEGQLSGRLRLDPGYVRGKFSIGSIEVRRTAVLLPPE